MEFQNISLLTSVTPSALSFPMAQITIRSGHGFFPKDLTHVSNWLHPFTRQQLHHMLNEVHPLHHPHEVHQQTHVLAKTIVLTKALHHYYEEISRAHLETVEIKKGEEDRVFCHGYCLPNDTQIGGGNVATIYVRCTLQNLQLF